MNRNRALLSILAMMAFLFMNACAAPVIHRPSLATIKGMSGHFTIGQILQLDPAQRISFDAFIGQIASKDLIFIGEVHDNPDHHLLQVQILQALLECCGPLVIAVEFLQKPSQVFIDQYLNGEITETEFLKKTDWKHSWGFDYHFYRPLFLLAKQNGLKMLAVNAPDWIVKKVARKGLENLNDAERQQIAADIHLNNEAHRMYLRKIFDQHRHGELRNFQFFYEAQCVWEDTMAENIADYMKHNRGKMVVITGNGHIIKKFGIPDRAVQRFPAPSVTVMPYPLDKQEVLEKDMADFVWLTAQYSRRFHNNLK